MLKPKCKAINKKGINYIIQDSIKKEKPWLGDIFAFMYDSIMEKSVFQKKFGANINRHFEILKKELKDIHAKQVIELAAGSGSAINFLNNDNYYIGTDISPGLIRQAVKKFNKANFKAFEFYLTSADSLPFTEASFDLCLCILALNFFPDIELVIKEFIRVAKRNAIFFCAVPVPERNTLNTIINGKLYSEEQLKAVFEKHKLKFESIPAENGAILKLCWNFKNEMFSFYDIFYHKIVDFFSIKC